MWQPRVEIEHYSVAHFDHVKVFEVCSAEIPFRLGLIICAVYMHQYLTCLNSTYEPCPYQKFCTTELQML